MLKKGNSIIISVSDEDIQNKKIDYNFVYTVFNYFIGNLKEKLMIGSVLLDPSFNFSNNTENQVFYSKKKGYWHFFERSNMSAQILCHIYSHSHDFFIGSCDSFPFKRKENQDFYQQKLNDGTFDLLIFREEYSDNLIFSSKAEIDTKVLYEQLKGIPPRE